jgi:catechol 2,3-dioxygenase-like lactoylglutathione lyase family enzyme
MTQAETGARVANTWAKRVFAITLFMDDIEEAKAFYDDVFQMPVLNEDTNSVAYGFPGLVVNLLTRTAAPELIEPAPVGEPGAPARMMLTIQVDDVDAVCDRLRARGVALLNGPMDRPWGPRTCTFADPSGHPWELSG